MDARERRAHGWAGAAADHGRSSAAGSRPGWPRAAFLLLFFALALPAVSALGAERPPSPSKVFLWEVRSPAGRAFLLGSIHFLKKEMYPLDRRIEEAFAISDALVVESDVEGPGKEGLETFVRENALYPPGDSLERHVSEETYALARRELAGWEQGRISAMKPWALAMAATAMEYVKAGLDPEQGIDMHFLREARGKKAVLSLEPPDEVVRLLDALPDATQDLFLFSALTDLAKAREEAGRLLACWDSGDAAGMEALLNETRRAYPKLLPVYEALVDRRSRAMAAKIESWLGEKRTFFVVVGAGHLVGREGIVELLRRKGYDVVQR